METRSEGNGSGPVPVIPAPPARPDVPEVTWRWWEAIVVFFIGSIVGFILAIPALITAKSDRVRELWLGLASEIGLAAAVILWLLWVHHKKVRALGLPARPLREVVAGFLGGLVIYVGAVFVVAAIVQNIIESASNENVHAPRQLPTHLAGGQVALAAVTVILAAPAAEELFFRGFLFRSLRARHGFLFAGGISALVFGLAHFQGQWQNGLLLSIVMCFVGFGLAYLYERRGNIVANIAAHTTFNIIGFILIVTLNR